MLPNWVGDLVMATPALRGLREALPGAFVAGLCRAGVEEVLRGVDALDELLPVRAGGVMGTKRTAQHLRHQFDIALLLTNSFSTALAVRMAGIPNRVGYDRDGRGLLLTERLIPPRRRDVEPYSASSTAPAAWAPVPAVSSYRAIVERAVDHALAGPERLELAITPEDASSAARVLQSAELDDGALREGVALLNPGGNDQAKRWPVERFAQLANHLASSHGLRVLINGSPGEAALANALAEQASGARCVCLPAHGITLGALKAIVRRCALMVTNDTGPRHIAAAFGVPTVTLFGPTDHRWTTIPHDAEAMVLADPTLPACEVANDHPRRCAIERIELARVIEACEAVLSARAAG